MFTLMLPFKTIRGRKGAISGGGDEGEEGFRGCCREFRSKMRMRPAGGE